MGGTTIFFLNLGKICVIYSSQLAGKKIWHEKKRVLLDYSFLETRNLKKCVQLPGGIILYSQDFV